jgi:hypothetical protein
MAKPQRRRNYFYRRIANHMRFINQSYFLTAG